MKINLAPRTAGSAALNRCLDLDRAAEFFDARGDGEGVQALHVAMTDNAVALPGARQHVESAGLEIDDGGRCDANLGSDERAVHVACGNRSRVGAEKTHLP